jgi:hypothetical protein
VGALGKMERSVASMFAPNEYSKVVFKAYVIDSFKSSLWANRSSKRKEASMVA